MNMLNHSEKVELIDKIWFSCDDPMRGASAYRDFHINTYWNDSVLPQYIVSRDCRSRSPQNSSAYMIRGSASETVLKSEIRRAVVMLVEHDAQNGIVPAVLQL